MTQIAPDSGVAEGELLPCPFCLRSDAVYDEDDGVSCSWDDCAAHEMYACSKEAWNKRAGEHATIARLQREAEGLRREYADCIEASAKQAVSLHKMMGEIEALTRERAWPSWKAA